MATYKRVVLTERDNTLSEKNTGNKEVKKSVIKNGLDKFDNSYTSDKLNELYSEFDAITFDLPSVTSIAVNQTKSETMTQSKVEFKTKVYLASAIMVTLLLAFLAIYNIFVINGLQDGIRLLQQEAVATESNFNAVYGYYQDLSNVSNIEQNVINNGFVKLPNNSIVSIPLMETGESISFTTNSNWFNDLCNFIGGMLGG